MYRPMDVELNALVFSIKLYNENRYKTVIGAKNAHTEILKKWELFNTIPVTEFSPSKWDKLNDLMQDFI